MELNHANIAISEAKYTKTVWIADLVTGAGKQSAR